jgi:hypothetical protein
VRRRLLEGIRAGAIGGVLGGVPSTVYAVTTGRSPFESLYAAGTLLAPRDAPRTRLALSGIVAHEVISFGWGAVLGVVLPRRSIASGAVAGLAIAALDLGLVGRRYPRIAALPRWPQVADHVAYGIVVGALLSRSSHAAR